MQQIRWSRAHWGWLVVVLLFAGCRGEGGVPLTSTPSEAVRQDAEAYARQFGVPVEEAIERLQFQDGIGDLNAALLTNEADTFGGLWIEHEPIYRVVALFTRSGRRTIRPYLAGKPYARLVEVRKARYTMAELETMQAQAIRELGKLDFRVSVSIAVEENRVEVFVSDRAWFESELRRVGAQLPEGVELVVFEGGSTARDKDLLLTPPVPGIAFPRQKPTEGIRESMLAELVGTLQLEGECLNVQMLGGGVVLPIWPPEFTLRAEGDRVLVIDREGQVAAQAGQEVYMAGGYVGVSDEWVLQQIPPACRGEYFVVGSEVRPNLRYDSELFALDVISTTGRTILFMHHKPALNEQVVETGSTAGKLVLYEGDRCLRLETDGGPGPFALLWPAGWSLRFEDDQATLVDKSGQALARVGEEVRLRGRAVPHDYDVAIYRQLIDEMPGECRGASWLVDGVDPGPVSILSFEISPAEIWPGEAVTLTWSTVAEQVWITELDDAARLTEPTFAVPVSGSLVLTTQPTLRNWTAFSLQACSADLVTCTSASVQVRVACPDVWFFPDPPADCAGMPHHTTFVAQYFERGLMVWMKASDEVQIYDTIIALYGDDGWLWLRDDWVPGMPEQDPSIIPPEGYDQPRRGFGKLWRENQEVHDRLGWATGQEFVVGEGTFQCGTAKYSRCYFTGPGDEIYVLEPYMSGWFIWPESTSVPVPSCLQPNSSSRPSRLIVQEHPLKSRPVPAEGVSPAGPGLLAYFETADGDTSDILERNRAARDTYAQTLASNNALLAPFGYRLSLKTCEAAGTESYTLYQEDESYREPVYGLYPVSVNASGTDFVMAVDLVEGAFLLTGEGLIPRDPAVPLPVYAGDELLTARVSDAIDIYLGQTLVYRESAVPGSVSLQAPHGLWSYDGHWAVELIERAPGSGAVAGSGRIIEDGQDLNQVCGYQESFGFALLDGRPFYFARRDARIDIVYDGQLVPGGYESIPHNQRRSVAALNPGRSQNMIWFFATLDYRWQYVEAYIPLSRELPPTACPSPTPPPAITPLPATAVLPGTPQPGAIWVRLKGWPNWKPIRYVPAGPFYMGSPEGVGGENERPLHVVSLDAFWIDETEVTHGDFEHCVGEGACDAQTVEGYDPLGRGDEPIQVTWDVAQAYCRWGGGRLPTEAEWEKAARGSDARAYPWGDEPPHCGLANYTSPQGHCFGGVAPPGSFPAGASPYGVLDLAGSVAEWVNDWFDPGYYARSPDQNPQGPDSGQYRAVRGGSWYDTYPYIRAVHRAVRDPDGATAGVRCVVPAPAFRIAESELYHGWHRYVNLDYGFSFHYPPEWRLEDLPHLIILRYRADETLRLAIDYARAGEDVGHWRTGMPAGDFVARGSVSCLGREISRDVLVYEGKDKMVLYNYSSALPWGEIAFGPVLEVWGEQVDYGAVDLPQDVQRQIDQVVASFEVQQ